MNKISKFLLSGAVVYSSAIAPILLRGEIPTTKQFLLDSAKDKDYHFVNTYYKFSGLACSAFTGYKLGEAFAVQSLASKLIGSFVGGVVINVSIVRFLDTLTKTGNIEISMVQNFVASGLASAALAYIWHEDSDTSELDQVSGGLSQSLQEDIPL